MSITTHAKLIATAAHYGQTDKGGVPRINHCAYVAAQMTSEILQVVAWLHDTLEDSPLTSKSALSAIFGEQIAESVDAITRRYDEQYFDYIHRVKADHWARLVKIEDIKHNMDRSRWPEMPESYHEREVKALAILEAIE